MLKAWLCLGVLSTGVLYGWGGEGGVRNLYSRKSDAGPSILIVVALRKASFVQTLSRQLLVLLTKKQAAQIRRLLLDLVTILQLKHCLVHIVNFHTAQALPTIFL